MRRKKTNSDLELYAVSGTHTVVLSMDMKKKPDGLLGFAFERVETKSKKRIWLYGQKFFRSVIPIETKDLKKVKGQKYPTHLHPVQSFLWKDFTAIPGTEYTYLVTAYRGTPKNLKIYRTGQITIATEPHLKGKHGIYFNRGVSGSQSYAEQFGNQRPDAIEDKVEQAKAYRWLSRGLYEGLLDFIAGAKPGQKLRGACYEFHHPGTLLALKAAQKKGVDVSVVYDAKNYGDENHQADHQHVHQDDHHLDAGAGGLVADDHRQGVAASASREARRGTARLGGPSGRALELSVSPLVDRRGAHLGRLLVCRDASRERAEERRLGDEAGSLRAAKVEAEASYRDLSEAHETLEASSRELERLKDLLAHNAVAGKEVMQADIDGLRVTCSGTETVTDNGVSHVMKSQGNGLVAVEFKNDEDGIGDEANVVATLQQTQRRIRHAYFGDDAVDNDFRFADPLQ